MKRLTIMLVVLGVSCAAVPVVSAPIGKAEVYDLRTMVNRLGELSTLLGTLESGTPEYERLSSVRSAVAGAIIDKIRTDHAPDWVPPVEWYLGTLGGVGGGGLLGFELLRRRRKPDVAALAEITEALVGRGYHEELLATDVISGHRARKAVKDAVKLLESKSGP